MRGASHRPVIVLLMVGVLVASCGSPAASPSPAPSLPSPPAPTPTTAFTPTPAPAPTEAQAPSATPADPFLGQVVVTVSDNLRIRSEPRVSDDSRVSDESIRYEPLLPLGTELEVLDGPVEGSGYVWYQVSPVSFLGLNGPGYGWVAMAGKDGEAWIALADAVIPGIELAKADVARAPADPAAAKTAAASVNAFGLDLLRAMLADPALELADKNAVFSPTSIALALAMARAGAKGDTATQMDAVLHTTGWDALGAGLNALEQALASRNVTWQDESLDPPTRQVALRIANSAFAQQDWAIEQAYLERIAATFGAGVRLVDYRTDYEAARKLINAWVSGQTKKRIPELIPKGMLDELTRLVLVNAIYLKANWAQPFSEGATKPLPFTRLDGSKVEVPTMYQSGGQEIPYARGNGWQAAELRYERRGLAMTLLVPDDLTSFENRLTASQLQRIAAALHSERMKLGEEIWGDWEGPCGCGCIPYSVDLFVPRFGIDTKAPLADVLKSLGMPLALTRGEADFSAIHVPKSYEEILYIQDVIHQANIDVDEEGTEASAATAVFMGDTGGGCIGVPLNPLKTITLRLDRPFLFVLRDVETGAILFMGRVVDPSVGR
jgi:serpin B